MHEPSVLREDAKPSGFRARPADCRSIFADHSIGGLVIQEPTGASRGPRNVSAYPTQRLSIATPTATPAEDEEAGGVIAMC
ncbi:MAG: hypothetical protein ABW034_24385 [Steroidobacteraceae bacterium]